MAWGCAAPDWRAGTEASCSQAASRPRGEAPPPHRCQPGRLEPGGGGGAVLSPTAAGPGVLGDPERGRAAALQVSDVRARSPWGVAGRRSAPQGADWTAAFEGPGTAAPRGFWAPSGAAPDAGSLSPPGRLCSAVPGPHPPPPPHSDGWSLSPGGFFSPWGLVVSRHVYIILMFVTVRVLRGCVFFALLPFCTSPTRTRPRELLLRSGPTPQATCLGSGFLPIESNRLLTCFQILRIN